MPRRWKQIRINIIVIQFVILHLLGCSLACSDIPAGILTSDATMTIEGLSVGSATTTVTGGQKPASNALRPPQVPLDVEEYPVAPHGLELEQVHVFVRHGM
jgi:hypothetical protein